LQEGDEGDLKRDEMADYGYDGDEINDERQDDVDEDDPDEGKEAAGQLGPEDSEDTFREEDLYGIEGFAPF
jgi:hypothetical protein